MEVFKQLLPAIPTSTATSTMLVPWVLCNPELHLNGGGGGRGVCEMAKTVTNAHILRPESGGTAGPCGHADTCSDTMTLRPDHMKILTGVDGWVEFEFKTPVPI